MPTKQLLKTRVLSGDEILDSGSAKIKKGSVVIKNPVDGWLYTFNDERYDTIDYASQNLPAYFDVPIGDIADYVRRVKKGEDEIAAFSEEYQSKAQEYKELARRAREESTEGVTTEKMMLNLIERNAKQGGMLTSRDYPTLKSTSETTRVEIEELFDSVLFSAVTRQTTDLIEIDKLTKFKPPGVSRNVGDFSYIYAKKGTFSVEEFRALEKDGAHVAWHDTFNQTRYDVRVKELHLQSIPQQMQRVKFLKIAEMIDAIPSTAAAGKWSDRTAGESDWDPLNDIDARATAINAAKGTLNLFVSGNKPQLAFRNNTIIQGVNVAPAQTLEYGNRVITGATEGIRTATRWVVDQLFNAQTYVIAADIRVLEFWQGPTSTFEYADRRLMQEGRIWIDYNTAINRDNTKTAKITGVV